LVEEKDLGKGTAFESNPMTNDFDRSMLLETMYNRKDVVEIRMATVEWKGFVSFHSVSPVIVSNKSKDDKTSLSHLNGQTSSVEQRKRPFTGRV
jgi:hypothetical protein